MLSHPAVLLLDRLEREERRLLVWGCVDGAFDTSEVRDVAATVARDARATENADDLVNELIEANWLFAVPHVGGRYRTRSAETVRLLARLRQIRMFPNTTPEEADGLWRAAPPLVADYRLLVQARRFPRRDTTLVTLEAALAADHDLSTAQRGVLRALLHAGERGERKVSGFQVRAAGRVCGGSAGAATIVCAGTGTGKTMAFYLPAFLRIVPLLDDNRWTKAVAIYPRNELLKDQLREALENASRVAPALKQAGIRPLVLGALYGDVPRNAQAVVGKYGWREVRAKGRPARECPFVRCPSCSSLMAWPASDVANDVERLVCPRQACATQYGPELLRLTRQSLLTSPPDILFTSTEMLNQRLASTEFSALLGIGVAESRRPVLVLLDEVHTYEGSHGAHVAILLRRWRHLSKCRAHFVGLSATLEDAARFFGDLVGSPPSSVSEVSPSELELASEGADYQIALRGDPMSGTSLLSTTIQTSMLMRRVLTPGAQPELLAGNKVFAFADNLDVVNRLFDNLRDAEGRWSDNKFRRGARVLAGTRSSQRKDASARYREGQSWDLAERIGHTLDLSPSPASSLEVHRTMALDPGVEAKADVVVATASLEVGYDDPRVGVVIQHKAPQSDASFLQRKGRAGRMRATRPDGTSVSMRPWTVVVLSDFGRDRVAYQDYERIFSPTLPPRYLPTKNRSLLRMQATYALFDWLGAELTLCGERPEPWTDLATWEKQDRRRCELYVRTLRALLEDVEVQRGFARHIRSALGVSHDEVQAILWEPPRAVMLGAAPTLLRRLETQWKRGTEATREPSQLRGPPLPEFVQKTLFGELLAPEVEVLLPVGRPGDDPEVYAMPLAQCLREFAPGRVSRRFGLRGNLSHWVDPGSGPTLSLASSCAEDAREAVGRFAFRDSDGLHEIDVYRPISLKVAPPPKEIAPTSNARTEWRSQIVASPAGHPMDVPLGVPFTGLVEKLRFHTHHLGAPVEVRRFALGARVALLRTGGVREPERSIRFVDEKNQAAALGAAQDVDAIEVEFRYPEKLVEQVAANEVLARSLRPVRLRDRLRSDVRLNGQVNQFQRDLLADALVGALVTEAARTGDSLQVAAKRLTAEGIRTILGRMALWASDDAGEAADSASEEAPSKTEDSEGPLDAAPLPKRVRELGEALDESLLSILQEHAPLLWTDIDASWEDWLRRCFKATLGASFHYAVTALCSAIDDRSLIVDLDADLTEGGQGVHDRFWVSETSIGGSGAIEAFYEAYGRDPRYFYRVWDAELEASDFERVSASLDDLLSSVGGPQRSAELTQRFKEVREATNHQTMLRATQRLRTTVGHIGHLADTSLMAAVHARLIRPGSTPALDEYLSDTVQAWAALEGRLDLSIDLRVFALCRAEDTRLERAVGISAPGKSAGDAAAWRYSNLLGVLWRRADSVRRESLRVANLFADSPQCDRLLVVLALEVNAPRVDVTLPEWFAALETALVSRGAALIHAPPSRAGELAAALLKVATTAMDTGGILVYGRAGPVRRTATTIEITIEMPEAFQ